MNKADLIEVVAGELDTSKAEAKRCVEAIVDALKAGLKKDEAVQLVGFGTLKVVKRKARKGRNPQTGAEIQIAASKSVGFKVGKALKDAMQ